MGDETAEQRKKAEQSKSPEAVRSLRQAQGGLASLVGKQVTNLLHRRRKQVTNLLHERGFLAIGRGIRLWGASSLWLGRSLALPGAALLLRGCIGPLVCIGILTAEREDYIPPELCSGFLQAQGGVLTVAQGLETKNWQKVLSSYCLGCACDVVEGVVVGRWSLKEA